jgi:hypothetical protein
VTKARLEVLSSECPRKWLSDCGVALSERGEALLHVLQAHEVVGGEHFALDNSVEGGHVKGVAEVLLDLIEPARVHGRLDDHDARMACAQFFGIAFSSMR